MTGLTQLAFEMSRCLVSDMDQLEGDWSARPPKLGLTWAWIQRNLRGQGSIARATRAPEGVYDPGEERCRLRLGGGGDEEKGNSNSASEVPKEPEGDLENFVQVSRRSDNEAEGKTSAA